ncbi:MAG TPA: methyltransferase [Pseudonocardiaceae bacterium]|nr:methyltransferase [Pseudonocardiaceae bacterium]
MNQQPDGKAEQQHYFSATPAADSVTRVVRVELPDVSLRLTTDAGVFSARALDPGTRVLLENAPPPDADGDILDLGCGYGPIALTMATRCPDRRVLGVDVNTRAIELANHNAADAGLANVSCQLDTEVPAEARFAAIYSNPPIRVGKAALHELLLRWLPRLRPAGTAYLVVQRNLGADSLARWLGEQGYEVDRISSHRGYRVLAVQVMPTD